MRLLHITITTQKLDESIKFYKEIAGLKLKSERHGGPVNLAFLADSDGATAVELVENVNAEKYKNAPSIGFHTDDVKAYREELIAKGYNPTPIISPIPNVEFFYVEDPNGVRIQFC